MVFAVAIDSDMRVNTNRFAFQGRERVRKRRAEGGRGRERRGMDDGTGERRLDVAIDVRRYRRDQYRLRKNAGISYRFAVIHLKSPRLHAFLTSRRNGMHM